MGVDQKEKRPRQVAIAETGNAGEHPDKGWPRNSSRTMGRAVSPGASYSLARTRPDSGTMAQVYKK